MSVWFNTKQFSGICSSFPNGICICMFRCLCICVKKRFFPHKTLSLFAKRRLFSFLKCHASTLFCVFLMWLDSEQRTLQEYKRREEGCQGMKTTKSSSVKVAR